VRYDRVRRSPTRPQDDSTSPQLLPKRRSSRTQSVRSSDG